MSSIDFQPQIDFKSQASSVDFKPEDKYDLVKAGDKQSAQFNENLNSGSEGVRSVLQNTVGQLGAGLASVGAGIIGAVHHLVDSSVSPIDQSQAVYQDVADSLSYTPKTKEGVQVAERLMYPLELAQKGIHLAGEQIQQQQQSLIPQNLPPDMRAEMLAQQAFIPALVETAGNAALFALPIKLPKGEIPGRVGELSKVTTPTLDFKPEEITPTKVEVPVEGSLEAGATTPLEQPGKIKGLGGSQGGAVSLGPLGEAAGELRDRAIATKEFLDETQKGLMASGNLENDLYQLKAQAAADRITVSNLLDKIKGDPEINNELLEKLTHYDENPSIQLSNKEQQVYNDVIKPLKDSITENVVKLKNEGVLLEDYTPRKVMSKGGLIDRLVQGTKQSLQGGVLNKSSGSIKHRTMLAAEDALGNRHIVSTKGGVFKWENGESSFMGKMNLKTNEELLNKQLKSIDKQLKSLDLQKKTLEERVTKVVGANEEETVAQRAHLNDRVVDIQEKVNSLEKTKEQISNKYNPAELKEKVFVDKDGNTYKLKQATIKEIEQNTNVRYYKNSLVNYATTFVDTQRAVRAMEFLENFKSSPHFSEIAVKENSDTVPSNWRTTDLPQFKGYLMHPQIANVLDKLYRDMRKGSDPMRILGAINNALRNAIFFNPLIHIPNITMHWLNEKGALSFATPSAYGRLFTTGARAIEAVMHQNADYVTALKEGTSLQYSDVVNKDLHKLLIQKMGEEVTKNGIAQTIGMAPAKLVKAIYSFSSHATWAVQDVAMLQSIYARMERDNISFHQAMRDVEKHIPNYRIPAEVGGKYVPEQARVALSHVLSNPNLTMFGAYHYGVFRSYGAMIKDLVGDVPLKNRAKALDQLAMLGLIAFVIYPLLDNIAKGLTGKQNAQFRKAGPVTQINNAIQLAKGKKDLTSVLTSIVTPAPATQELIEQFFNFDTFTHRKIRDKEPLKESVKHLATKVAPLEQGRKMSEGKVSPNEWAYGLAGINFPKR